MTMTTRKVVDRSAVTGRFVTEKYAKQHPRTTEREHVYTKVTFLQGQDFAIFGGDTWISFATILNQTAATPSLTTPQTHFTDTD